MAKVMDNKQTKPVMKVSGRPKKRLFIGMLLLAVLLMAVGMSLIWYIARLGLYEIAPILPLVVAIIFVLVVLGTMAGIANMVLAISGGPYLKILRKFTYKMISALFPVAVSLGKPLGVTRRQLEGSFIATSNLLFNRMGIKVPANKLLVVTPHCLQLATCPHKITRDPHNCKRCGGCDIGVLVTLADEMGFTFFVATGGTLARQIVYKMRPQAVLAIACERDLMSGIQDVYPLPAVGVLNIRPNGPCYNTHVDIEEIKAQLAKIIITEDKK